VTKLEEMKVLFNSAIKNHPKPCIVIIKEQLHHAMEYKAWKASGYREGIDRDPSKLYSVKWLNILYRLPYWKVDPTISFALVLP